MEEIIVSNEKRCIISNWKVKKGQKFAKQSILCLYKFEGDDKIEKLKSLKFGCVEEILIEPNTLVEKGQAVLTITPCQHLVVMKQMCAECGADLRNSAPTSSNSNGRGNASVSMVHSVPELTVSLEKAIELGQSDEARLLSQRKLVLLVDLDQTLVHTTNDNVPPNLMDVYHFQLWPGGNNPWYHAKFRPGIRRFLENISNLFELHICTFGARIYAHIIARYLDPDGRFFSHRILSRDECFNPNSKTANLRALFPHGDHMVCIIDDREDVWKYAPNLVHVKPYSFFDGTADIHAPPALAKPDESHVPQKRKVRIHRSRSTSQSGDEAPSNSAETKTADALAELDNSDATGCSSNSINDKIQSADDAEHCNKATVSADDSPDGQNSALEGCIGDIDSDIKQAISATKAAAYTEQPTSSHVTSGEGVRSGKPASETGVEGEEMIEWEDTDDYLIYLEDILRRVHTAFYELHDQAAPLSNMDVQRTSVDVKKVVPYIRRKVLRDTHIVFSGVVPTNQPMEQSRAFRVANSLGATVETNIGPEATHVVAAKWGTQKVHEAKRLKKVHIVTPEWLWCCYERWERVDERLFHLSREGKKLLTGDLIVDSPRPLTPSLPLDSVDDALTGIDDSALPEAQGEELATASSAAAHNQLDAGSVLRRESSAITATSNVQHIQQTDNIWQQLTLKDIEDMDHQVDEVLAESSSDSSADENEGNAKRLREKESSDDAESLSEECPRGWAKKRRRVDEVKDTEEESSRDDWNESIMRLAGEEGEAFIVSSSSSNEAPPSDDDVIVL